MKSRKVICTYMMAVLFENTKFRNSPFIHSDIVNDKLPNSNYFTIKVS